jgi:hypothetical protein
VLLGRETGSLQLLASLLLTGGKGADLVIRGNVILNMKKGIHNNITDNTSHSLGEEEKARKIYAC